MANLNIKFIPASILGILLLNNIALNADSNEFRTARKGAMCYKKASIDRLVANFICSKCGKLTTYNYHVVQEINNLKRLLKGFKSYTIKVDDMDFCKHCKPQIDKPMFRLQIAYPDKNSPIDLALSIKDTRILCNHLILLIRKNMQFKKSERELFLQGIESLYEIKKN